MSLSRRLSTVPAKRITDDKYTVDVVKMAQIVPIGIDFWASAKSPERFDPAIMPVTDGKKIPIKIVNDVVISATTWPFCPPSAIIGSISSGFFPTATYCPFSRKLS